MSFTLLAHHAPGDLVAVDPGRPGRARTAADLARDARRVAGALAARRGAGDRPAVVVAVEDRYLLAAAVLGAWEAGLVAELPPSTLQDTVERLAAGATALLHDGRGEPARSRARGIRALDEHATDTGTRRRIDLRALLDDDDDDDDDDGPLRPIEDATVVAVVHTSGSTGEPLPVPKTAGQLLGEARAIVPAFGLERLRVAASAPGHHIYGLLFGVLAPLAAGGALLRRPPLHAEPLAAALRDARVDVLVSVPAHLRALLVLEPGALPPALRVLSSGAPLPADTARALHARLGLSVTEVLGSTETGGIASRVSPGPGDAGDEGAWRPLPGVGVAFASDGHLLVDSPWLDPAAQRPVATADRAEPRDGGAFRHLGRGDGVVKVGGVRVSRAEIERLVLAIPGVLDATTLVIPHPTREREVVVAASLAPGATLDAAEIRAALARELEAVAVPRRIHLLDALPREPTGKLPRARLLAALGLDAGTRAPS